MAVFKSGSSEYVGVLSECCFLSDLMALECGIWCVALLTIGKCSATSCEEWMGGASSRHSRKS